ncbi:hypothetical protein A3C98_04740 [Candidatus Roizmanbacteria bacterium RIFCSPHIGHO2_02_FULL_37_15]|uniref:YYY membrane protein n=1 Tax=Candidatus Roizmanbacteria bacterium RIFCSPLOWO2_01_FULL_37_16 TaxID=1802058 RepID=A0A1F7IN47_9BACT|nr:MAG: hypothetical protein A2859_02835 [Candidatus Roizmanbacteria bacterium RIFCSPHIGHO2_01_FULL_37_16b]OGK21560.1 MAG: hypothetical protein A3C98_04740 [Candidatus Roizmanbacteria bacterium RIFCSPHIGHO2_02_FULL_37_15]OGK31634.1 MAG: hypothetical protein A3F57_02740 [Candidatus Roizmanbacteria bacterium RIFCSPHIGHO2_12_FULL_36_11]OGK44826.1 MAG: hypothetical protein A3B40_05265 [Candidatus Roizmanbacteria bacterium RIFCSPLOWO2_01_FULL_37_16]OGK56484.1 MAG: hypothetical protein A3I50_04790 [C
MNWVYTTLKWYLPLFILGVVFFPLAKKIFGRYFPDLGYAFSKILAILFTSYTIFVLGVLKIVPFSQTSLIFLIVFFSLINLLVLKKIKIRITNKELPVLFLIIFEEFLFLGALLLWNFVRGQEPSIRGLEKFMDFGFINSILRAKYFPPLDMWLSPDPSSPKGYFINYYYFGHLTGAFLIKLTGIKSAIGYNLLLGTIFALSVSQAFSLTIGIINTFYSYFKEKVQTGLNYGKLIFFGILGSYIVNLGGNLHTIYLFTKGYPNESPVPFWKILSWYNPTKYWYPNATRFIPNTIHEFPSYSWVVADLHGHVFDIPVVLLTLAVLFIFFLKTKYEFETQAGENNTSKVKSQKYDLKLKTAENSIFSLSVSLNLPKILTINYSLLATIFLGFLTAVHYMTNAFDGPIYILLTILILFTIYKLTKQFIVNVLILIGSFLIFVLPFSLYFKPFVTGIGVNCSPEFLTKLTKIGPFLFEKGNCQVTPIWMLFILWGFFFVNLIIFLVITKVVPNLSFGKLRILNLSNGFRDLNSKKQMLKRAIVLSESERIRHDKKTINHIDTFILILFLFGSFLIIIPEFFYIKDIYPAHFRANTMFKLGYQAFIIMGIASTYTFFRIKLLDKIKKRIFVFIFIFFFFFVAIYPLYSIPSYYGQLNRPIQLDGSKWLEQYFFDEKVEIFSEDKEMIDFINSNIKNQPVILEAQGDSYTDYERISAYTGLPTVAGWWVHEWLWRGSVDAVGNRIADIENIYQSPDINQTLSLIKKYKVNYVVVSTIEKKKYPKLNQEKFSKIGELIFKTSNSFGALYKVDF